MFAHNNLFKKFALIFWLPGLFVITFLATVSVSARQLINHPDGRLGHIGIRINAGYTSESAERGVNVSDKTRIGADLLFPYIKILTIGGSYKLEKSDSLYHNFSISARIFTFDPLRSPLRCNPDGRIGGPIIMFSETIRFADTDPGNSVNQLSIELSIPLSFNFTLGAGANFYNRDKPEHADDFFGIINFYPVRYREGKEYANPDGIEGVPSFTLRAGGSKFGKFGRLDIIVPLQTTLSVGVFVMGEEFDYQQVTNASLGAQISFYRGN